MSLHREHECRRRNFVDPGHRLCVVIVEVPNPNHPYGLRGVGEVPVVPTLAAIGNAIGDAIGIRPQSLPMSPPKLLELMDAAKGK